MRFRRAAVVLLSGIVATGAGFGAATGGGAAATRGMGGGAWWATAGRSGGPLGAEGSPGSGPPPPPPDRETSRTGRSSTFVSAIGVTKSVVDAAATAGTPAGRRGWLSKPPGRGAIEIDSRFRTLPPPNHTERRRPPATLRPSEVHRHPRPHADRIARGEVDGGSGGVDGVRARLGEAGAVRDRAAGSGSGRTSCRRTAPRASRCWSGSGAGCPSSTFRQRYFAKRSSRK